MPTLADYFMKYMLILIEFNSILNKIFLLTLLETSSLNLTVKKSDEWSGGRAEVDLRPSGGKPGDWTEDHLYSKSPLRARQEDGSRGLETAGV